MRDAASSMARETDRRPRLWHVVLPLALVGLAFAILVSLGFWQLQRKAWKDDLVAQIEARAYGEPASLPPEAQWPLWRAEDGEYARVRASGIYLFDKQVAVHGLAPGEGPGRPLLGYYVLTPLRLESGAYVIVNRGFIAPGMRANPPRPPSDAVTVTGLLRASEPAGGFTPDNVPAKGEWYRRDVGEIAAAAGLSRVAPFILDADAASSGPEGLPRAGLTRLDIPNRHLEYAFTWFGLAATLLGVVAAFVLFRRRRASTPR